MNACSAGLFVSAMRPADQSSTGSGTRYRASTSRECAAWDSRAASPSPSTVATTREAYGLSARMIA